MPWRAEMDMCPEPELPSFFSPTMGPPHELHVRTRVHARHSIPRNKSLEGRMNCTRVSPHQLSSWLLTRSIVSSSQRPMSGCHSTRFPTQTIATTTSPLGDQSQCWNAFGNLWANHRYPDSPCNHSGGVKVNVGMCFGNLGPPPIIETPCKRFGRIKVNVGMCFENLWATNPDIETPLATTWGNQSQCWNALLGTSGPPASKPRLPLQPLGGMKANVGCFWEPRNRLGCARIKINV